MMGMLEFMEPRRKWHSLRGACVDPTAKGPRRKHAALAAVCLVLAACCPPALGQTMELDWAAPAGSASDDGANAVAVDGAGNVYAAGYFQGTADFAPGPAVEAPTATGASDAFVAKYGPDGALTWVRAFGGVGVDRANGVAVDGAGNVFVVGEFEGAVDFDPGLGTTTLTSAGLGDAFVAKFTSDGDFAWARSAGGSQNDVAFATAVDQSGRVYTAGYFRDTADFDPGPGTSPLSATGASEVFVQRLTASGDLDWARAMGGPGEETARGLALDSTGNVHVVGYFQGTADFDPGPGTESRTSAGDYDAFVVKLDGAGQLAWAQAFGGTGTEEAFNVGLDAPGGVHVVGQFEGTVDFDPSAAAFELVSAGAADVFVLRLDASGGLAWAVGFGSTGFDEGLGLAVDAAGGVYATGWFTGTADLDPGPSVLERTSAGSRDVFVQKLDATGVLAWATAFGGPDLDLGFSLALAGTDMPCVVGRFGGTVDFDPGEGSAEATSAGGSDAFVLQLAPADSTAPSSVAITPETAGPTNADAIAFTVVFDEAVAGFDGAEDVVVSHAGTSNAGVLVSGAGDTYTATLTGVAGNGSLAVSVSTASGVTDLVGNPLASSVTSEPVVVDNTPPVITGLAADPSEAAPGELVAITFAVDEDLAGDPSVLVAGTPAVFGSAEKATDYAYTWLVPEGAPEGPAPVDVTAVDIAGNVGTAAASAGVLTITPSVPLVAWPAALAFIGLGALAMRRRRP